MGNPRFTVSGKASSLVSAATAQLYSGGIRSGVQICFSLVDVSFGGDSASLAYLSTHQKLTIFMHGLYFAGTSMAH